jgi:RNA polymerase sigma-70 factor (ECF subfamily)
METSSPDGGIDRRVMNNIRFNARRLARGQTVPGMAVEDYEQDLVLDLLHRLKAFNPKLASFATYADRVVSHRISTLASPTLRLKEERRAMSLDAPAVDDDSELTLLDLLPDDTQPIDESAAIRIDVGRFVRGLPPRLLSCCEVLQAESFTEGAIIAGIHRSTAYERVERLRAEAAARGLAIYFEGRSDSCAPAPVSGDQRAVRQADSRAEPEWTRMQRTTRPARPQLLVTEMDLRTWLAESRVGEALEYHRGFLALDRLAVGSRLTAEQCEELDCVARAALAIAEQGRGHLLQRRYGHGDYGYLLVARPKPPLFAGSGAEAAEVAS